MEALGYRILCDDRRFFLLLLLPTVYNDQMGEFSPIGILFLKHRMFITKIDGM